MYEKSYKKGNSVNFCGYKIPIPDMPPKKDIIGYGKKKHLQKFEHTPLTEQELAKYDLKTQERLILQEWHKREHGIWTYINGEPIYIPGAQYHFLNYWPLLQVGTLPKFYYRNTLVYYLLDYLLDIPDCFGIILTKGRRFNMTEITNHHTYEYQSRTRNTNSLLLNKNEDDVKDDFKRILYAHQRQPYFFKPISPNDNPASSPLVFDQPTKRNTDKDVTRNYDYFGTDVSSKADGLSSYIHYKSTTENVGDGKAFQRVRVSEYGKIDPSSMNIHDHWFVLKPTMLRDGERVGFAIYESTIEEMFGGKTLEVCKKLWNKSNPSKKLENGQTESGLYRVFIPFDKYGLSDEFGMPDIERANKFIESEIASAKGNAGDMLAIKRKYPVRESDVWSTANNKSPFNLLPIAKQMEHVNAGIEHDGLRMMLPRRGDLLWTDQPNGNVRWVDSENGRFLRSQEPRSVSAYTTDHRGRRRPTMGHLYCMGVDPYNTQVDEGRKSDGAAVVFKKYDYVEDQDGTDAYKMKSNQPVMIYAYRHENPEMFYEDMMKMAIYWSCEVLYENNRSGMDLFFNRNGLSKYMMIQPSEFTPSSRPKTTPGAFTTERLINQYVEYIKMYLSENVQSIRFIELLQQLSTFTQDKRGRLTHDLVVAFGFALLAAEKRQVRIEKPVDDKLEDWVNTYKA